MDQMREKYESLSAFVLKDLAKARGLKGISSLKKGEIIDLMKRYGVSRCIYGHLHSDSLRWAVTGMQEGIDFTLVSGDYVDFTPVLLKK